MKYQHVCIEAFSSTLPDEVVSSEVLEARLEPVYRRFRLAPGMLQAMYGICQRRFWPRGMLPSVKSTESAAKLLERTEFDRGQIGALVHGSVCRDYVEPATACVVHHALGLSPDCMMYDVSNACLGILTGMVQVANMIELGQIRAGIVVGTECARRLVETTLDKLNSDTSLTRNQVNEAIASLTTGSGSVAVLLTHASISRTRNRLCSAVVRGDSSGYHLCHSGYDESIAGDVPHLMETNSAPLVDQGIALVAGSFDALLAEAGWSRADVDRTICHQVGSRPRKLMLQALAADPAKDLTTYETLGNTGAAAIPLTMAMAIDQNRISSGQRVALLGNGSGVNSLLLAVAWCSCNGHATGENVRNVNSVLRSVDDSK